MLTFVLSPRLEVQEPTAAKAKPLWQGKGFVLFGVHSCDLAGISFNDQMHNFLHTDPFPTHRRQESIIIGIYCLAPCPDSFCRSMGSLNWNQSADLMLTDLGEEYSVQVLSDVGQRVVDYAKKLFLPGTDAQATKAKKILKDREQRFPDPVKESDKLPGQLEACYEGGMWDRIGKRCFGCGNCTNVCPTCFCFDVNDQVDLSLVKGTRIRSWDSCQLTDFAVVAGGQNFRPTIASRLRFRIYHKFRVEPEQVKQIGCVGCGRCTRICPADIDMIELLTDIQKGGK
jgi:formate hydrogenlyase subunit 6/NADH:ubiquinone oxidoreductase subunit I